MGNNYESVPVFPKIIPTAPLTALILLTANPTLIFFLFWYLYLDYLIL